MTATAAKALLLVLETKINDLQSALDSDALAALDEKKSTTYYGLPDSMAADFNKCIDLIKIAHNKYLSIDTSHTMIS